MGDVVSFINAMAQFSFVIFIAICATYYTVRHYTYDLPRQRLRAANIAKHGWPPAGLDADGDWHGERG